MSENRHWPDLGLLDLLDLLDAFELVLVVGALLIVVWLGRRIWEVFQ